jgi:5-methylcytosine-specific restriction endonuclease McrA
MTNIATQFKKGHKHSTQTLAKLSLAHKGKPAPWLNSPYAEQIKERISKAKRDVPSLKQRGDKHYNWKGGITSENAKIRHCLEYRIWRRSVFERDKYMCVFGGKPHGNKLEADHIKKFSDYPELRFAIDNGRTLCLECHRKVSSNAFKKMNDKQQ